LKVTIAGVGGIVIKGAHDIIIKSDMEIGSYKGLPDALVLPGGLPGVENLAASRRVSRLIIQSYKKGKIVAAICAAPSFVLAPTHILDGRRATCYPG
jgi:4-methyl-5(b-hydroxyethyl)-thiazole monophosphate biosynthesis